MPKALSGEILADPVVLIDRRQHYSFNRRVKARGAQSAGFWRNSSQHTGASDSDPGDHVTRVDPCLDPSHDSWPRHGIVAKAAGAALQA
jgi:hypothetical protein